MALKASLVMTTIYDSTVLETYFANLQHYGHLDDVETYVIADRKTPREMLERCASLARRGLKVMCPTLNEQEEFLRQVGFPPHLIPYDSDNRRNIGYLMALRSGSDFMISIDDDNYCRPDEDVFAAHAVVCERTYLAQVVETDEGWFNICTLLELDRPETTYPRGFPYYARHKPMEPKITTASADVHINAGLWLVAPDVDAINWLVAPMQATSFKGPPLVLGRHTWSPINTQNTAFRRDAVAAYYYIKMGYPLGGITLDRYSDIFSGYLVEACVKHLGGGIRVGTPVADHRRNSHNYLKDAAGEWGCIPLFEDLLPWLHEVKLSGRTYLEIYAVLGDAMEDAVEKLHGAIWTDAARGYFHQVAHHMRKWATVASRLL
ncbi:MAG: hypothetical protein ACHQ9S_21965 [Candidatus Binatia bacterium]